MTTKKFCGYNLLPSKIAGDIDIIRSDAYCLSSIFPKGSYTKRRKRVLLRSLNSGLPTERQSTYYNFIIKKVGLADISSKPFSFSVRGIKRFPTERFMLL